MGEVCAADIVTVLRELLEAIIPPHRRARGWDRKWTELEVFAHDADEN